MLIDSHCHLQKICLDDFDNSMDRLMQKAKAEGVTHLLSVCVELEDYPRLCELANTYENIYISVGLHPDTPVDSEPNKELLVSMAKSHPSCIAIGETGLDYYRITHEEEKETQVQRFRQHIQAAIESQKPLIIHTRSASFDTLRVMQEERAKEIGGVMHCFTETWEVAKSAMEMNFYISLSGILTFKNAENLRGLAKKLPLDRILIETDSPYLAPVPHRGKQNHPALVKEVAKSIAELRGLSSEEFSLQCRENFKRCFRITELREKA